MYRLDVINMRMPHQFKLIQIRSKRIELEINWKCLVDFRLLNSNFFNGKSQKYSFWTQLKNFAIRFLSSVVKPLELFAFPP